MIVLVDKEILFFKAGHQPVHGIGNGERHQHQVHIHTNPFTCARLQCRFAFDRRWFLAFRRWGRLHVNRIERIFLR